MLDGRYAISNDRPYCHWDKSIATSIKGSSCMFELSRLSMIIHTFKAILDRNTIMNCAICWHHDSIICYIFISRQILFELLSWQLEPHCIWIQINVMWLASNDAGVRNKTNNLHLRTTIKQCQAREHWKQEKKEEIWLSPVTKSPYTHRTIQKATWQHKNATKNFDYTTIADRLTE